MTDPNTHRDPLETYRSELRSFDWYYDYSDDYSYWAKASGQFKTLQDKANRDPAYRQVWNEVMAERQAARAKREGKTQRTED